MEPSQQLILVIMGVTGTGKSTVATLIAEKLRWDFQEGDELHPTVNVAKMASGIPLTDDDRWPWLQTISQWIRLHDKCKRPGIVTCSALKRDYREVLRGGCKNVVFVHLTGTREQIHNRITMRSNHFMPSSLLDTQIEALEPVSDEERPMLVLNVDEPPEELADQIIHRLCLKPYDPVMTLNDCKN